MPLKSILTLSIFIQVAINSAAPRSHRADRLSIRAPNAPDAPNNNQSNVKFVPSNSTLDTALSAESSPSGAPDNSKGFKATDSPINSKDSSPKVTTNKVTSDVLRTNITSFEEFNGGKTSKIPTKETSTSVTDRVTHTVLNTNTVPDHSSTQLNAGESTPKPEEPTSSDSTTAPKAGHATPKASEPKSSDDTATTPKTSKAVESTETPKLDDVSTAAKVIQASPITDDSKVKSLGPQGSVDSISAPPKAADALSHAIKNSGVTVPKTVDIQVGNLTEVPREHPQGALAPTHDSVRANLGPSGMTGKTIDIQIEKPNGIHDGASASTDSKDTETHEESHGAGALPKSNTPSTEDGTHPPVTSKATDGASEKIRAPLDTNSLSLSPKTSDNDATKASKGPEDHPNAIKGGEGTSNSHKSSESISAKELETESLNSSDSSLHGSDQPASDKSKSNNTEQAFAPNVTALLKEPPSSNEKSNALLLLPQFKLNVIATTLVAASLALIA